MNSIHEGSVSATISDPADYGARRVLERPNVHQCFEMYIMVGMLIVFVSAIETSSVQPSCPAFNNELTHGSKS